MRLVAWLLAITALVSFQLPWVVCAEEEVHLHFSEHDHCGEDDGSERRIGHHHENSGTHHERIVWTVIRTGVASTATQGVSLDAQAALMHESLTVPFAVRSVGVPGNAAPPAAPASRSTVLLL